MDLRLAKQVMGIPSGSKRGQLLCDSHKPHESLGPKITEIVKGKLSIGAKILQLGSVSKIFRKNFSVREGEKLLLASQCSLSTTGGPIAGRLFISTEKIAFCSERSIKTSSTTAERLKFLYKVLIPLGKLKGVRESINMSRPSNKYLEIVTVDNFDFWFMGFANYNKTLRYLNRAMSLDTFSN